MGYIESVFLFGTSLVHLIKPLHVSSVVIFMFAFYMQMYKMMKPTEVLASLVAAICHDMDHPGVNQNYLVNTSSYLAAIHGVS